MPLTFKHKMNRLKLAITDANAEITETTDIEYTIGGMITSGTFNTKTGVITNDTETGDVTFSGTGAGAYLIYSPQAQTNKSLTIHDKTNGKYYSATIPTLATTADNGTTLGYNVNIKGESVQLTLVSVDITGWGTEDGEDIDAEEKKETTSGEASSTTWGEGTSITVTAQSE